MYLLVLRTSSADRGHLARADPRPPTEAEIASLLCGRLEPVAATAEKQAQLLEQMGLTTWGDEMTRGNGGRGLGPASPANVSLVVAQARLRGAQAQLASIKLLRDTLCSQ